MKNKHLVLIFLLTLVVGLVARRLPWRVSEIFQTDLIEVDTSALQSISINRMGGVELLLERADIGWVTDENDRPVQVPAGDIGPMLEALAHIQSIRIIKTDRPDTLGLDKPITVKATWDDKPRETFHIGKQTMEGGLPATYIELDHHEGIYLVKNHLRNVFDKNAAQFRPNTAFQLTPDAVYKIRFFWNRQDSIFYLDRNDSLSLWEYGTVTWPQDTIGKWLQQLPRLNGTPFADHFDDSRAKETLVASLTLRSRPDTTPLELRFFYYAPPEIPEEPSAIGDHKGLSSWVLHSSQNPLNYFCIHDTVLLKHILYDISR